MGRASKTTREKILDAAEALFAERGYYGVSIREITSKAKVELALPNYYFGRKQNLFQATIERRVSIMREERRAALAGSRARAGGGPIPIENIIDAFVGPFLTRSRTGGRGWKNYARLIAQVANSPSWQANIISPQFDEVAEEFIDEIRRTLPDCDPRNVYWGFHFLLGAMILSAAETGRIEALSKGLCESADLEAIHKAMVPFVTGGFKALCQPESADAETTGTADSDSKNDPGSPAGRVREDAAE
ncbi:MAG: TetR/AcrR family transcriptional regulator [Alphaproteobacteria bacterium]